MLIVAHPAVLVTSMPALCAEVKCALRAFGVFEDQSHILLHGRQQQQQQRQQQMETNAGERAAVPPAAPAAAAPAAPAAPAAAAAAAAAGEAHKAATERRSGLNGAQFLRSHIAPALVREQLPQQQAAPHFAVNVGDGGGGMRQWSVNDILN